MKGKVNKQEQKRIAKKRAFASILAIILALAMIVGIAAPFMGSFVSAAEINTSALNNADGIAMKKMNLFDKFDKNEGSDIKRNFDIEAVIGFDNNYILEKTTPVTLTITNNETEDFMGEVQIKISLGQNYGNAKDNQFIIFFQPLELPKGATKKVFMDFEITTLKNHFDIELVDMKGNIVFTKKSDLVFAYDPQVIGVGVLCENSDDISYLKNLKLSNSLSDKSYVDYDKVFFLDKYSFPFKKKTLENFKLIIIDDFNTSMLSVSQKDALKEYLLGGGYIAISVDKNKEKVLSGIQSIVDINEEEFKKITINGVDLKTTCKDYGQGKIFLHDFSFNNVSFGNTEKTLSVLNSIYTLQNPTIFTIYNTNEYNYDYTSFSGLPYLGSKNINLIFIILVAYIILVGPGIFYFLKKKDKLEKAWYCIPALAVVFTIVIFGITRFSIYRNGIANFTNYVQINSGSEYANTTSFVTMAVPDDRDINLTSDKDINLGFQDNNGYYGYSPVYREDESDGKVFMKVLSGEKTDVTFFDLMKWENIQGEITDNINMGGKLETSLEYKDGKITGYIKNNTSHNFENVLIFIGKHIITQDDIKSGEREEISFKLDDFDITQDSSGKDWYERFEKLFNTDKFFEDIKSGDITREKAFDMNRRKNMAESFYRNYTYSPFKTLEARIIAFDNNKLFNYEEKINGSRLSEFYQNMYIVSQNINYSGSGYEIPYGIITPSYIGIDKGHYDFYNNEIYAYEKCDVLVQFSLNEAGKSQSVKINWEDKNKNGIKFEALNNKTGVYDKIKNDTYISVDDYVDESGTVNIKTEFLQEEQSFIPEISLKGDGANA